MPLPYYDDDYQDEIIRTEYNNLKSPEWWKAQQIDGLVLYSWGAPRYRHIAKAVHQAGIQLVLHMDTSGDFIGDSKPGVSLLRKAYTRILVKIQDFFRAKHLRYADVITTSPAVALALSKKIFYSKDIVKKNFAMPCPVDPACRYEGEEKKNIILCIGRWEDEWQKRPAMLMRTIESLFSIPRAVEVHIYGTCPPALQNWKQTLPEHIASRVKLLGNVHNHQLREAYKQAKIILCTSRYEGSHNVSAEALCCGCSVVAPNRPAPLRTVLWYTSKESGTISKEDTPESLAEAMRLELQKWETGQRNPHAIAKAWQPHFHTNQTFNKIFQ